MDGERPHSRVARDALRFNLVFRRAKLQLSQAALAEQAGISRPTISELEQGRGNVTLDVLNRLAFALETTVAQLFTPAQRGTTDEDVERRLEDGSEAFVDARDFLAAIDEIDGAVEPTRFSKRGRKAIQA